jgi:hypothetical protein
VYGKHRDWFGRMCRWFSKRLVGLYLKMGAGLKIYSFHCYAIFSLYKSWTYGKVPPPKDLGRGGEQPEHRVWKRMEEQPQPYAGLPILAPPSYPQRYPPRESGFII